MKASAKSKGASNEKTENNQGERMEGAELRPADQGERRLATGKDHTHEYRAFDIGIRCRACVELPRRNRRASRTNKKSPMIESALITLIAAAIGTAIGIYIRNKKP